mmetsp:Transcript_5085/g.5800  ORF Transcript_5085/g.5800 Transcript_5085/m.5800 type:complete len:120 (-) Transcript_5085:827-1186(-)
MQKITLRHKGDILKFTELVQNLDKTTLIRFSEVLVALHKFSNKNEDVELHEFTVVSSKIKDLNADDCYNILFHLLNELGQSSCITSYLNIRDETPRNLLYVKNLVIPIGNEETTSDIGF